MEPPDSATNGDKALNVSRVVKEALDGDIKGLCYLLQGFQSGVAEFSDTLKNLLDQYNEVAIIELKTRTNSST